MLIGHQKQWQFLKGSVKLKKISHAYLFTGEVFLGKKTIAKEFIKLLYCQKLKQNNSVESCQNCRSCKDVQEETHPDLTLVSPKNKNLPFRQNLDSFGIKNLTSSEPCPSDSSQNKEIYIKQIREISRKLLLKSYSAPFKTIIIEDAHLMNQEAQSCLLKILEEPRGKSVLILLTQYPQMLFPTIFSRVQKIKFQPVDLKEIENYLINQGADKKFSNQLSIISQGRPGVAINFFRDKEKFEIWKKKQREVLKIIYNSKNIYFRFQYLKNSMMFLDNPIESLNILLNYFREILLFKNGVLISGVYKDFISKFWSQINIYSFQELKKILENIEHTKFLLSTTNINSKLALETFILEV